MQPLKKLKRAFTVRPFSLKWERLLEWQECLRQAERKPGVSGYLNMLWLAVASIWRADKRQWRARMRTCAKCPIYDRDLKRCGVAGTGLGCGCYVVYKALAGTCWLREQGSKQGWSD